MANPVPLPPKPGELVPITEPVTAPTPHELLSRAVLAGAPIEVVERLSQLVERWEDRKRRAAFEAAMARVRAKGIPLIKKSRRVDFSTAKGRTSYEYEDFADVAKVADDEFPKEGITYRFRTTQDGNKVTVTCIIAHEQGYYEENSLSAFADESGNKNSIQAVGSAVTYLQRYTLKPALGLAASVDDDGRSTGSVPISADQYDELLALIQETSSNHELFCKVMGVTMLNDLPTDKFNEAKRKLLTKKERQNAAGDRGVEDGQTGQANREQVSRSDSPHT